MAPRSVLAAALALALAGSAAADPKDKGDEAVSRAVKGGQAYLKAVYANGQLAPPMIAAPGGAPIVVPPQMLGLIPGGDPRVGGAWLAGLALIESGLTPKDAVVAALARRAREAAISAPNTYQISLLIMFLDRIGEKDDEPLIQFLTLRLLSGQTADGSWSYLCDGLKLDPVEERALYADLTRGAKLTTPDGPPPAKAPKKEARPRDDLDDKPRPAKKDDPAPAPAPKEAERPAGLHPALKKYADALKDLPIGAGSRNGVDRVSAGDRSNTQFATVALWCGRRHHVPVGDALAALDKHYRGNIAANGGWSYTIGGGDGTPAMTCAGLMGLAMGFGAKGLKDGSDKEARLDADAMSKDPVLQGGLKLVGNYLAAAVVGRAREPGMYGDGDLSQNTYFMWSLERVGMAYGLTTIGKVDWYDWGSKVLVRSQNRDGSWMDHGGHAVGPENATAFALLFLCRADLTEDFRNKMKGKVQDPGTSKLRSPADAKDVIGKTPPKDGTGTAALKTETPVAGTTGGPMADALVSATGAERESLMAKYRDPKGAEYTDALARAIPKLTGEAKTQVRDALAQRATRFTAATLNAMMGDKDTELRRAAALAAGAKGRERVGEFAESLVKLMADDQVIVVQAARAALKTLTGEDRGPEPGASPADRTTAIAAWRNWLAKQK
jgi:hypothetical protein